jgi:hypothetical protein
MRRVSSTLIRCDIADGEIWRRVTLPHNAIADAMKRLQFALGNSPVLDARFSYRAGDVVQTLDKVCSTIGYPKTIRVDQGTEFVSRDPTSGPMCGASPWTSRGPESRDAFAEAFNTWQSYNSWFYKISLGGLCIAPKAANAKRQRPTCTAKPSSAAENGRYIHAKYVQDSLGARVPLPRNHQLERTSVTTLPGHSPDASTSAIVSSATVLCSSLVK